MIIVSDTSCISNLQIIGKLELLHSIVIDEIIGRKVALQYGISVIGILGVLILAKRKNLILSVKTILDELKKKAGFWVGDDLYSLVLKKVDEYP